MGDVYMVNGKILSGLPNHAKDIIFDNDGTTLSSTNTEDAIKEVNSNLASQEITGQITLLSGTIKVYKTGKTVMVSWDIGNFTIPNGNSTIATNLPLPCTPASSVAGSAPTGMLYNAGGNGQILPGVVFVVDSTGNLNVSNHSGAPISGSYKGTYLMYICQ